MKLLLVIGVIVASCVGAWYFIGALIQAEREPGQQLVQETKPLERPSTDNDLIEIYDGVNASPNNTKLDLSGRSFRGSLKAEVRLLRDLEVLNLSNNGFTALPAEIGQLSKLRVLNLSNNPITGLPHEIGNLQNLELLDVSSTTYSVSDLEIIREALPQSTVIVTEAIAEVEQEVNEETESGEAESGEGDAESQAEQNDATELVDEEE